jgi:hypothetical protein
MAKKMNDHMANFFVKANPGRFLGFAAVPLQDPAAAAKELDRAELPVSGVASSNVNSLVTADACDPISGSVALRSFRCDIELDPSTDRHQRRWAGYRPFCVRALTSEADDVRGLLVAPLDGRELPHYWPGQHLELKTALGADVIRAYSLTGSAREADRKHYRIAVRQ